MKGGWTSVTRGFWECLAGGAPKRNMDQGVRHPNLNVILGGDYNEKKKCLFYRLGISITNIFS